MTASTPTDTSSTVDVARRAWFRAGVRRRDRAMLRADLEAELAAAAAGSSDDTVPGDAILGDDPATAARAWADARGVTDRRLRLLSFVLPALLVGVVAAGAILALLADAFADPRRSLLGSPGPATILSIYTGSAVLAIAAIAGVSAAILRCQRDTTAGRTARVLLIALPVGGILAAALGIWLADLDDFAVRTHTFVSVSAAVVVILALTMVAARWLAVRAPREESGPPSNS